LVVVRRDADTFGLLVYIYNDLKIVDSFRTGHMLRKRTTQEWGFYTIRRKEWNNLKKVT